MQPTCNEPGCNNPPDPDCPLGRCPGHWETTDERTVKWDKEQTAYLRGRLAQSKKPACPHPDCPNPPEMLCRSGRCAGHCRTDCPASCPGEPDDPPDTDLYDPGPIIVDDSEV